jgi:hypothetical protein
VVTSPVQLWGEQRYSSICPPRRLGANEVASNLPVDSDSGCRVALYRGRAGIVPSGSQQQTSSDKGDSSVTVMARNVYHGVDAELNQVATASSFPAFLDATPAVYKGYHERNFPKRAVGLAGGIEETQPDVVGADPADRTPSGLWPSDHAGVVAELRLLSQ